MAFQASMTEALRLTRAGDLAKAAALIRDALNGSASGSDDAPAAKRSAGGVIDLVAERAGVEPGPKEQPFVPWSGFEARRHVGAAGAIDYMLYRPKSCAAGMPLVVMLHGCTQSPEDFARGTRMNQLAEELGFLVVYPRQTQAANQQRCWNWFRPGDQQRGCGEPALIAGLTQDIIASERVDGARVYVAGLSAGGAAAAIMAEAYPDLFAAVGIHSGLACGAARDLPSALTAMKRGGSQARGKRRTSARAVPVITFHGDRDGTVHEVNAREIVEKATASVGESVRVETETGAAGGRRYTRSLSRDEAGRVMIEQWTVAGAGHAWSGGDPSGSYADPTGPDASREMLRFFLGHRGAGAAV